MPRAYPCSRPGWGAAGSRGCRCICTHLGGSRTFRAHRCWWLRQHICQCLWETEQSRGYGGVRTDKGSGAGQWSGMGRVWRAGHRGLRGPTEASLHSWLDPPISMCSMVLYKTPWHPSKDPESQDGVNQDSVGSTNSCPSKGPLLLRPPGCPLPE